MNSAHPANCPAASAADAGNLSSIEAAEVYERLVTSRDGLSTNEAKARLLRFGPNAIPADARVVSAMRLRIDVSSFTGESRPLVRTAEKDEVAGKSLTELSNILLAGTYVSSGRAKAVVFAVGQDTEFGRLAALTRSQPDHPSSLQQVIRRMIRTIKVVAVIMGLVCFTLGAGFGQLTPVEGLLFALGIIVANFPEGLLSTIALALPKSALRSVAAGV